MVRIKNMGCKKISIAGLFLFAMFLFVSTAANADNGVSQKLAQCRARALSDVRYELSFTVPASLSAPVCGKAKISFLYRGNGDLPLDFTGKIKQTAKGKAADCYVNSKPFADAAVSDEHIVVPKRLLRKGANTIEIAFESSNAALNRHADYMYTLFVPANARSCFPCFDQPDLKARFALSLHCPDGWESINSADSHPISTYLFSFVCGKFHKQTAKRDGRTMTALYRETDSAKVAQLGKVFDEAAHSIKWLENYTGIPYPFDRYGFVVLPGYQFGGMEHPGAIQFTDHEIFLGQDPTPDEELTRLELIAHETAHMWFGDMVTMRWFDDVWTKEVFANFMANKISREVYPDINHNLNFLKSYQRPALSVDRTDGTHPIQQPLGNLNAAGLLYGNIIYDKAPVMMRKLEQQAGADHFRNGLRAYLSKFRYRNATWDDLINILDSVAPQARLKAFSDVWVKQKGLPTINYSLGKGALTVSQSDPFSRGIVWQQRFCFGIDYGDSLVRKEIDMNRSEVTIPIAPNALACYPNIDGEGYGRFAVNPEDMDANLRYFINRQHDDETGDYSILLNLHENYLMGRLSGKKYFEALCKALDQCDNALLGSTIVANMATVRYYASDSLRHVYERSCLRYALTHNLRPVRQQMLRALSTSASDGAVLDTLYNIWTHPTDTTILKKGLLTTRDFTRMAYQLAIMMPDKASAILTTQRTMLRTDDERREFDYVSRACTSDTAQQRRLFLSLIPKSGRTVEPWARQMLALLCDQSREPQCNSYIEPGLDHLLQIQQSSDIFFPGYWLSALLSGQHSAAARTIVRDWISDHADYPLSLINKLKQSAYSMFCTPKD